MHTPWHHNELLNDLFTSFRSFKALSQAEFARHELAPTHFIAMRHLQERGVMSMSRLTELLEVTHGASTGVVDKLCKLGLVVREHSPQDRRVVEVALTAAGVALCETLARNVEARFESSLASLDEAQRAQVVAGVSLLAGAFRTTQSLPDCEDSHAATR